MKAILSLTLLTFALFAFAQQRDRSITGQITDSVSGKPLKGVTIELKGSEQRSFSDQEGWFTISIQNATKGTLVVSFLGYTSKIHPVLPDTPSPMQIQLVPVARQLDEVIVSTGYESLSRERATGSFEKIDERLFNRATGTNVLSRLDGITTGTFFDRRSYDINGREPERLTIRGISTLRGIADPLIILDNFPYEGDPANINPNDVADITILKDAAAASIWGTRAGNGVIIITSKQGTYSQPTRISLSSVLATAEKPDLFADNTMSSTDFIDVEQFLFETGYYNAVINSRFKLPLSPVSELLLKVRQGSLDSISAQQQINRWRSQDVRNDFLQHVYRHPFNQQYALNISGGTTRYAYTVSGGFDHNLDALVSNRFGRTSLRSTHQFKVGKKLDVNAAIRHVYTKQTRPLTGASAGYGTIDIRGRSLYPYAALADDQGTHLAIPKDYRQSFTDTAGQGRLLDWKYRPLDEIHNSHVDTHHEMRADVGITYRFAPFLQGTVQYMHQLSKGGNRAYYPESSYYSRNLINEYTQLAGDQTTYAIPMGGILRLGDASGSAYGLRGQLNANQRWGGRHHVVALGGMEMRENRSTAASHYPRYGYDDINLTFISNLDFATRHPIYDRLRSNSTIPNSGSLSSLTNRFVSIYGNASYTLDGRYIVSASFRRDASNIFGVEQNDKWSPLWSAGLSWLVSEEPWYGTANLPYLKLRATYGYSGNIDPSVAAQAILTHVSNHSDTGLPYAWADSGPNPTLRWEKVRTINFGVDFRSKNNRISGSAEYYLKRTQDLLAGARIDPTYGFGNTAMRNTARTRGQGVDLSLNTRNLVGRFSWDSHLVFGFNKTIITDYYRSSTSPTLYINAGYGVTPVKNQVASPIYSYAWQGLDPETGDPIGLLNGEPSKSYYDLVNNTPVADLVFHGSATPLYFGGFRNDFQYKNLTLSINCTWYFDYYFRRPALSYYSLYDTWGGHEEFSRRWQKPGDERTTNVPSMPYPADSYRDVLYQNSAINVLRGDHIRLQDIRLAYRLSKLMNVYAYANNLGIIWRANDEGLDPQTLGGIGLPRNYSVGFTLNF